MFQTLQKNLLVVVVTLAAITAWLLPAPGLALKELQLVSPFIFLIFLCQGAAIDVRRFRETGHYTRLLGWGFVISFLLAPLFGWLMMNALGWQGDFRVGFLLMCCMGPTLVSGIVVATQAGGESESAALLTIVLNLVAVLMIPVTLGATLGDGSTLDQGALLSKLLILVLIPAVIGQVVRLRWPDAAAARQSWLKTIPVLLLGMTIYISLAEHNESLREIDVRKLLAVIIPALSVHLALLLIGFFGADKVLGSGRQRATSLAFVCSQKTLPVAIAVWAAQFASTYPLAILPPLVFHLSQIAVDSLLAAWWVRRMHHATEPPMILVEERL